MDVICGPLSATTSTLAATRHDPTRHLIANEGAMVARRERESGEQRKLNVPLFSLFWAIIQENVWALFRRGYNVRDW